jgi:hypothetical protein
MATIRVALEEVRPRGVLLSVAGFLFGLYLAPAESFV